MPREHVAGRWTTAGFLMLFLAASASAGTATGGDQRVARRTRETEDNGLPGAPRDQETDRNR